MTTRRTALLIATGGFALAAASLLWAADQRADELLLEMKLRTLIQQRIATAERGVAANQAAYDSGTVTLDQIVESRRVLAEARLAAAKTAAERETALEEIVHGYRQMEEKITSLYKTASRGGEAHLLAMIQYARQTAEIGLLEVQIKDAAGK